MRLLPRKPVVVKGTTIGGEVPLICLPIVARDEQTLLSQARKNLVLNPDLIEWRADFFDGITDLDRLRESLGNLNRTIGKTPLIFTCRSSTEGGARSIDPDFRLGVLEAAAKSRVPDLIDFELSSGETAVRQVTRVARDCGVATILSFHDFEATPAVELIKEKLAQAQSAGGDIAKVAVTPRDYGDVLNLFRANLEARETGVDIPIIAMAMGKIGAITRLAGFLFGSDVTFAVGEQASAPGQIPVDRLRKVLAVLRETVL